MEEHNEMKDNGKRLRPESGRSRYFLAYEGIIKKYGAAGGCKEVREPRRPWPQSVPETGVPRR
ncbi:hypothetical protein PSAB_02685 [Paenibacillus sabinae T27]|uniref:Uncharacterized protein n=1 Tax=Paenibacillus sabinae T27 TaxID=1268072 RepID=X4ZST7_9BACL|nr:hypothetical protein PSAB_02685 [Paenibacillus sabinae T27]